MTSGQRAWNSVVSECRLQRSLEFGKLDAAAGCRNRARGRVTRVPVCARGSVLLHVSSPFDILLARESLAPLVVGGGGAQVELAQLTDHRGGGRSRDAAGRWARGGRRGLIRRIGV